MVIGRFGDSRAGLVCVVKRRGAALARGPGRCQYSLGNKYVVALRSASVMIQSVLSPKPLQGLLGSIG
jgi:hypothetical protein